MANTIYRVTVRFTQSLQPGGGTHWSKEVVYCGFDRQAARNWYHANEPHDNSGSPGNRCRQTVFEEIKDSGGDPADDEVEEIDLEDR